MSNYRYLIILISVTALLSSVVIGQQRFIGQRAKSKFRPFPEWFANMQPPADGVMNYDEQNDQPVDNQPENSQFQTIYVDDAEENERPPSESEGKFVRSNVHKTRLQEFQSLCPHVQRIVDLSNENSEYEYNPSSYVERICQHPYRAYSTTKDTHHLNQVCGGHKYSCIQVNSTVFLTKRKRGTDCWQFEVRNIRSDCQCMWPKHLSGDILHAHLKFDKK